MIRYFLKASKMNSAALERILANNLLAEQSLQALKREFATMKDELITKKISEIQKENDALKNQVEVAKQQLIKLETANGKVQILTTGQSAVAAPALPVSQPLTETKQQSQKKEKPAKKDVVKKAPAEEEVAIDVSRLDLRVGKIVEVCRHPDAENLYLEKIDCGEAVPRTVVSGLVRFFTLEEMQNRMVIVLCNLKPAKMRGVVSEAMVMCASTPDKVEIMAPPEGAVPGDLVQCEGFERIPDTPFMNPKKKVFETVAPDLMTSADLVGTFKGSKLLVVGKGPIKSQTLRNVNIK